MLLEALRVQSGSNSTIQYNYFTTTYYVVPRLMSSGSSAFILGWIPVGLSGVAFDVPCAGFASEFLSISVSLFVDAVNESILSLSDAASSESSFEPSGDSFSFFGVDALVIFFIACMIRSFAPTVVIPI